jgi:hypothetical protein
MYNKRGKSLKKIINRFYPKKQIREEVPSKKVGVGSSKAHREGKQTLYFDSTK